LTYDPDRVAGPERRLPLQPVAELGPGEPARLDRHAVHQPGRLHGGQPVRQVPVHGLLDRVQVGRLPGERRPVDRPQARELGRVVAAEVGEQPLAWSSPRDSPTNSTVITSGSVRVVRRAAGPERAADEVAVQVVDPAEDVE
jgi:hypothetical protein